jgi:hypothetical protein
MLRGLYEITDFAYVNPVESLQKMVPLEKIKDFTSPYLGTIAKTIQQSMPRLADPENVYWIYQGNLPSFRETVVSVADAVSTVHPNYLLVIATFVFAFFILYIQMKYPFWNQIPALHVYDWHRRFLYSEKPFIIHILPKKTKYYEPKLVETRKFRNLEETQKSEIAKLLQNHYLPSDRVFCSVKVPDLAAQCADAVISMYLQMEEDIVLLNREEDEKENPVVAIKSKVRAVEGFITSRRINTAVSLGSSDARIIVQEPANYIDYLCFNKKHTSSHKIRKLFHTHEYNTRLAIADRNITLFKKEVELCDAIIPLVEYESLTFYLRYKIEPRILPTNFQMVRIQREHLRHLHDWMDRVASLKEDIGYSVSVTAEIGDLIHLLQTNQMFAYALRGPDMDSKTKLDTVYAIYFFRNAHMKYEDLDGGDTIHAVNAFCNTDDFELYFLGFQWAVKEARKDCSGTETKMLMVDDLGHLRGIANRWMSTHDVILRTKCAYYFCNYVLPKSPYNKNYINILV